MYQALLVFGLFSNEQTNPFPHGTYILVCVGGGNKNKQISKIHKMLDTD